MRLSRRNFICSLGAATTSLIAPITFSGQGSASAPSASEWPIPILLNRNENAYGTSPAILASMRAALKFSNRYPYPAADTAAAEIARFHGVDPKQVLLGCGSTEILRICANAFLSPGRKLLIADPTFEAMGEYARANGGEIVAVPLNHRYEHDLNGMLTRADSSTALVYICNPNNPTATITPKEDLESFLHNLPRHIYVVMDEAYHHYAGASGQYASWVERAAIDTRLIVTRTFSKIYGLAGMRVGYAVASNAVIRRLMPHHLWGSVNIAAAHACSAALQDKSFVQLAVKRNQDDRQEFFNQAQTRMIKPLDSHANFFFLDTGRPASGVIAHFRKHNILIGREFASMATFVRVTLGRPEEMREFWRVWDLMPAGKMSM